MRKEVLFLGFLVTTPLLGAAAEFYCPKGGEVTIAIEKQTPLGEVFCIKKRYKFQGYISITQKENEIVFTQCNKKEVK